MKAQSKHMFVLLQNERPCYGQQDPLYEFPRGRLLNKNEKHEDKLVMLTNQSEDSERCESMELDNKICDLIERNVSPDPGGVTPGPTPSHRSPCSVKTPEKPASVAHFLQCTTRMSGTETSTEHAEWTQSSRRKNLTNFLEQKIRCLEKQRKELLEVNQQWDQQFRSMKKLYERKVTELKTKLDAAESFLGTLEKELQQSQRESDLQQREEVGGARGATSLPPGARGDLKSGGVMAVGLARLYLLKKEKESLNEELHELKRENKLLKEKIALASQKKQHFECEIKRLNKALQDALKMECSSSPEDCLRKSEMECSHEEMRTEMEVLKQQVQIYEEDFKKERSDRERLNQEKEELQQINQTSQTQLNRLNSQIKACQMEKEKLERQLKQMYFLTSNYGWIFTYGIHAYRQALGLCRIYRSTHQTVSGMLPTCFRQMCRTRRMVRPQLY
ncbi:LOW QUALITY PROTEIN: TNFAIP3-interacting protein 3 [Phocoena phocoena]|uniref:LOW QUALITY PROTEIN: TNFAIP3-interacting protein 3 n=1 Tax=Phocoena phocoena TaxID=9742 RepID=UPI0033073CBE